MAFVFVVEEVEEHIVNFLLQVQISLQAHTNHYIFLITQCKATYTPFQLKTDPEAGSKATKQQQQQ